MTQGAPPKNSLPLALSWQARALEELEDLEPEERERLQEYGDKAWDAGVMLALLDLINKERESINLSITDLAGRFDVYGSSTVVNWFKTGKISSPHLAMLLHQPEFRHIRVPDRDAVIHGYREAITWVRCVVLEDEKCKRRLAFDEFFFLYCLHAIDERDVDEAFEQVPAKLKNEYPDNDATWLLVREREWGKAYRIAALQENNHED